MTAFADPKRSDIKLESNFNWSYENIKKSLN